MKGNYAFGRSIVAKMVLLMGVLLLVIIAMVTTNLVLSNQLKNEVSRVKVHDVPYNQLSTQAYDSFLTMDDQSNMWLGLRNYGDKSLSATTLQQVLQGQQQLNASLQSLQQLADTSAEQALVAKSQVASKQYEGYFAQIQKDYNTNPSQAAQIMYVGNANASNALTADLQSLVANSQQSIKKNSSLALTHSNQQDVVSWIAGIIALLLTVGILLFILQMVRPLPRISLEIQAVADGDLTRPQYKLTRKDEIGDIARAVSAMVQRLREIMTGVLVASENVSAASQEISAATEEIASGSTLQANASESVNQMFRELSDAIASVAQSAEQAAELSNRTTEIASDGHEIIQSSMDGMNSVNSHMAKLSEDSNRVGEIVEVIDEIADQTNLLALNAAIEAARAGDQGRGFAVVADEVRKLAERTSEATKQIGTIIKTMQSNTHSSVEAVKAGVTLTQKSGEAFQEIVHMVNQSAEKVSEIAAASEEQAAQASEVLVSVESIASTAEESAASSEQTAASSQTLAQLAEQLNEYVAVFKVS